VSVHPHLGTRVRYEKDQRTRHPHVPHRRPSPKKGRLKLALLGLPFLKERVTIVLEHGPSLHHGDALVGDGETLHVDAQAEPIEQLGSYVPLLGIHRAHEDEAGGV
jgi:hypothetical protein